MFFTGVNCWQMLNLPQNENKRYMDVGGVKVKGHVSH